jgi:GxxExxY protein
MEGQMELNVLTGEIVGAAIEVHRELGGTGLLEEIYESAMVCELELRGLSVQRQVDVPVLYKGHNIKKQHCLDLLVEGRVIIEVKAVEKASKLFEFQLLTYLRLTQLNVGLLINFGETQVRQGVRRVINELSPKDNLRVSAPPC